MLVQSRGLSWKRTIGDLRKISQEHQIRRISGQLINSFLKKSEETKATNHYYKKDRDQRAEERHASGAPRRPE